MKLACIGTGFVGVVTSAVFAKLGNEVIGLDIDEHKIKSLSEGKVPFFEPDLQPLLQQTLKSGNLRFTTSYQEAITDADVVFIMVGTPSRSNGEVDLKYVFASADSMAPHIKDGVVIVLKSTAPPGTNDKIKDIISAGTEKRFSIASVPEFLSEGSAVHDTLNPTRVLIGADDDRTKNILVELHKPLTQNIITMKPESAQMAKYSANVYLAQRITFINQIANICEKNGADVEEVIQGIGHDSRIGLHYWYPGLGYGGSCFPKDVKEMVAYADSVGERDSLFAKINDLNEKRIPNIMKKYNDFVGGFTGKTVAVLGLAFKPNTNDTRESPSLKVIQWLLDRGATVKATDPQAIQEAKQQLPAGVEYGNDPYSVIEGSDVVMLIIEWSEYLNLDIKKISDIMNKPAYFIDTRNKYNPRDLEKHGLRYKGIGR